MFACPSVYPTKFPILGSPLESPFQFFGCRMCPGVPSLMNRNDLGKKREEYIFTFISLTRCLNAEFFKLDLRLNAQQTPESVMAGLNNSEQFLWRPWGKGFIQGILQPPKGSLPRKKTFLLGLSQNGGTALHKLTLTLF